jgi:hypothetical protein
MGSWDWSFCVDGILDNRNHNIDGIAGIATDNLAVGIASQ